MLGVALRRAVELDCDRRVLRRHPDVESYGATLLAVSARGSNRLAAAAAFAESDVPLRKRILAMTTPPRRMSVLGAAAVLVTGIALLSCTAAVPVPAIRVASTSNREAVAVPTGVVRPAPSNAVSEELETTAQRSSTTETSPVTRDPSSQPQQALPEPRVVASKEQRWMVIHRSVDDFVAGNPPIMRVPRSQSDSAFAAVYAMLGDSSLYALRDSVIDGLLPIEAAGRLPVGTNSPPLPSDSPPPVTVPPRILNPEEIVRSIQAAYPSDLLARGRGGTVGMQFHVGPEGEILRYQVGQISAYAALDSAAMDIAAVYRFSPGLAGGVPVAVWVAHAISFYPPD
jgi:TonB family protein